MYVKDLTTVVVKNADDMDRIMNTGNLHRTFSISSIQIHTYDQHCSCIGKVGGTLMNARSSRSHAIFTIVVERSDKVE